MWGTQMTHGMWCRAAAAKATNSFNSVMGPPRKIGKILAFFGFFRPTQKMGQDGPKWAQEDFFLTNPDLAVILGRTDFDFENFYLDFLGSQISGLGPHRIPIDPLRVDSSKGRPVASTGE